MRYKVEIDKGVLSKALEESLKDVINPKSTLYRQVAIELIPVIQHRIHIEGKAADGRPIGKYSNSYLKMRTGNYGNSDRFKKGKNVGKNKNAGTYTKGDKVGSARPKYNRTGDDKVILSLTRQLENDYAVIAIDEGWGIGFHNSHNADKARWNHNRYKRPIFDLSDSELQYAVGRTTQLIEEKLK